MWEHDAEERVGREIFLEVVAKDDYAKSVRVISDGLGGGSSAVAAAKKCMRVLIATQMTTGAPATVCSADGAFVANVEQQNQSSGNMMFFLCILMCVFTICIYGGYTVWRRLNFLSAEVVDLQCALR